jgi:hypothetical protein
MRDERGDPRYTFQLTEERKWNNLEGAIALDTLICNDRGDANEEIKRKLLFK